MTKITKIDKTQALTFRKAIQKKLDEVGEVYGMIVSLSTITYDDISIRATVKAVVNETDIVGVSTEQKAF